MTDDCTASMIFIILIKRHYDMYIMKALGLCSGQLQNRIASTMRVTHTFTLHKAIKDFMFSTVLDKIKNKENKNKKNKSHT